MPFQPERARRAQLVHRAKVEAEFLRLLKQLGDSGKGKLAAHLRVDLKTDSTRSIERKVAKLQKWLRK